MAKRIEGELETVGIMIEIYCRHHHGTDSRWKYHSEGSRMPILKRQTGVVPNYIVWSADTKRKWGKNQSGNEILWTKDDLFPSNSRISTSDRCT